jgi:hypothetical protein
MANANCENIFGEVPKKLRAASMQDFPENGNLRDAPKSKKLK